MTKEANYKNVGVFYYDRQRWNGPVYGVLIKKSDLKDPEFTLSNFRKTLKKKVRFGRVDWKLL